MTDSEYFSRAGLSNSSMKDLAVSPFRFWHLHINPNRPEKRETPEMKFGSALHCAVLEPEKYEHRFASELVPEDIPGCLRTADDLRGWLKDKALPYSGKLKGELIDRIQKNDPTVKIFDVEETVHAARNRNKTWLSRADWDRCRNCAEALRSEPAVAEILSQGRAEVPMFATHPETGVLLKGKLDWVRDDATIDIKTFSQQRGKSIDRSVTDAIWYEGYAKQAYLYGLIRSLQPGFPKPGIAAKAPPFTLCFVESEAPFEVRLRSIVPVEAGTASLLWERARYEVTNLIRLYASYVERYGDKPWREPRQVEAICDEEIPALAYA